MKFSFKTVVYTLIIAAIFKYLFQKSQESPGVCMADKNACYYSEGYFQARARFRELAKEAGADLIKQSIQNQFEADASIDVAIFRNEKSKKTGKIHGKSIVHYSGVHGVEGYAGSAIQLAFLENIKKGIQKVPENVNIFVVHAVNPFGFLYNRRFNENNVDLNRNMMESDKVFEELNKTGGKARSIYDKFDSLFNPQSTWVHPSSDIQFAFKAAYNLIKNGLKQIKTAVVSGQYYKPKGIYYGGDKIEESTRFLQSLYSDFGINNSDQVIVIDVHTGLGPQGVDTFMVNDLELDAVNKIFSSEIIENSKAGRDFFVEGDPKEDANIDVSGGYALAIGQGCNIMQIAGIKKGIYITQEFGTTYQELVLHGMIVENTIWHHGSENQKYLGAKATKRVFYIENPFFKQNVVDRGVIVLAQAVAGLSNEQIALQIPQVRKEMQ